MKITLLGTSFRAIYRQEVERGLARSTETALVTELDLAPLPPLVQSFLRRVGVVGRPRVRNVRARWRGTMRSKPEADWMPVTAEQHNFFDEPSRVFLMKAKLFGIPFESLHLYTGRSATMRVRLGGVFQVVDARGPEMDRSETVTMFNDICLLAPSALLDANVTWETVGARTVRGTFTNAGHMISALLSFDETGDLVDFSSNDRDQSSDGKTYRRLPWSTPVCAHAVHSGLRLVSRGEAKWAQPEGDLVYAKLELVDVDFNLSRSPGRSVMARALQRWRSWLTHPRSSIPRSAS